MVFLQAGVPKSGNLWLYKIVQGALARAGIERRAFIVHQPIYGAHRGDSASFEGEAEIDFLEIEPDGAYLRFQTVHRRPIFDVEAYVRACSHVWTHSAICARSFEVLPLFDKVIYVVRDPRDVAVSLAEFAFTPHVQRTYPPAESDPRHYLAEHLDPLLRHWVRHVGGYLGNRSRLGIHFVFYERLLHAFDAEASGLFEFLGLPRDAQTLERIRRDTAFSAMHKRDPSHLRSGKSGHYRRVLTDEQCAHADRIAGKMLRLLRYPAHADDDELPGLPSSASSDDLDAAVRQSRLTLRERVGRLVGLIASDAPLRQKVRRGRTWMRQYSRR